MKGTVIKILIVDDSLTVRKIVKRYLLKHGYDHIDEAVDGKDALALLQQYEYGCIFLDINMPVMDGFTVLEWLNRVPWRDQIHVVVMSTEVIQLGQRRIRELQIDTVIPKPFTGSEFERTAVSLLNVISSKAQTVQLVYDGPIMIIDDSLAMRNIIRKQLENLNCLNVTEAVNGKDGLEKISEWAMLYEDDEKMGIVFLDLTMPVMDGLQLIEILEEKELLSKLQIIVLSGSIDMALTMVDGSSIMSALPKPFEHTAFVQAFRPLIEENPIRLQTPQNEIKLFFDAKKNVENLTSLDVIEAESVSELSEFLFAPFESMTLELSFPKERLREIPKEVFFSCIQSVYRSVLMIDHRIKNYFELEYLYDQLQKIDRYESQISAITAKDILGYVRMKLLPKNNEYAELSAKISRYRIAIKTLIERKNKLIQMYKETPSKQVKETYEKYEHDLASYRGALESHDKQLNDLSQFLENEIMDQWEQMLKLQIHRMTKTTNQVRAEFDRSLWKGMRASKRFRSYCNAQGRHLELTTQSWLEHENNRLHGQLRHFFEVDFRTSILIVGFKDSEGSQMREELKKNFPTYDIQAFTNWTIKNYGLPYVPNLLILNRESQEEGFETYLNEVAKRFETSVEMLNTLTVYKGAIKSSELIGNDSLYNLKLKNYMKMPSSPHEYTMMALKAKSLIF